VFTFTQPYVMYRHYHHSPACDFKSKSSRGASSGRNNKSLSRSNSGASDSSASSSGSHSFSRSKSSANDDSDVSAGGRSDATNSAKFNIFRKNSGRVVIEGIDGMMADCASLNLMVEGIGEGTQMWADFKFRYVMFKLLCYQSVNH
jgi:hypothetical protein